MLASLSALKATSATKADLANTGDPDEKADNDLQYLPSRLCFFQQHLVYTMYIYFKSHSVSNFWPLGLYQETNPLYLKVIEKQ